MSFISIYTMKMRPCQYRDLNSRQTFFRFTTFRLVLFMGLCGICVFASIWGLRFFYFFAGEGSTYVYRNGNLAVHFLDVGHGDCTIVQLPDDKVAVIDGGNDDGEYSYYPRVKKYLDQRIKPQNKHIDYLINTHPHSDHLGGLVRIAQDYRVGTVYIADVPYPDKAMEAFARAGSIEIFTDDTIIGNDIFEIRFYATAGGEEDANEASPIIIIRYASQAFIITGDAGFPTEKAFFECSIVQQIYGQKGEYFAALTTYLKVGHHGSRYSTGNPDLDFNFLDFIKPDIAIISAGTASQILYNHPHPDTLARLAAHSCSVYLTRDDGNIVFQCAGDTVQTYFAFDHPPDLSFIWLVVFVSLIFCFVNFERCCKKSIVNVR